MSIDVLDDLPFPFNYGSCHEYNDDFAIAGAGADNKERCWELSGATDQWTQAGDTTNGHYSGDLAKVQKVCSHCWWFFRHSWRYRNVDPIKKVDFKITYFLL